tara:strand:- start:286 stop:435 length:150 start_codon:yes stop_codon:yes gene_type:complete
MDQDSDEEEKAKTFGYDSGYKSQNSGMGYEVPQEPVDFTDGKDNLIMMD